MTSKCTRTILRIKRRRTEEPLPYIRLEGLDGRMKRPRGDTNDEIDSQHLSELLDNADLNNNEEKEPCRSSVVWKRLTPEANEKQSYRIVDALLEEDGRMTKRRKLTLLETSSETEFPSVVEFRTETVPSPNDSVPLADSRTVNRISCCTVSRIPYRNRSIPQPFRTVSRSPHRNYSVPLTEFRIDTVLYL